MLVIVLAGAVVICISGLVSVFVRTTVESLLATVGVLVALYLLVGWPIFSLLFSLVYNAENAADYSAAKTENLAVILTLAGFGLVLFLIFGTYRLGLYFFKRKQF
jgi:hypothetical protein